MEIRYIKDSIKIELPIKEEFSNATLKIYCYNFKKGRYDIKEEHEVSFGKGFSELNCYTHKVPVTSSSKIKCEVEKKKNLLAQGTIYIGSKHNVTITKSRVLNAKKQLIDIFELCSEIPLSRNTIFYTIPNSKVRIYIPEDLQPDRISTFTIKDNSFIPKFECINHVEECLQIVQ